MTALRSHSNIDVLLHVHVHKIPCVRLPLMLATRHLERSFWRADLIHALFSEILAGESERLIQCEERVTL